MVAFVFFVIEVVDREHEYCVDGSHWLEHAAKAVADININIAMI